MCGRARCPITPEKRPIPTGLRSGRTRPGSGRVQGHHARAFQACALPRRMWRRSRRRAVRTHRPLHRVPGCPQRRPARYSAAAGERPEGQLAGSGHEVLPGAAPPSRDTSLCCACSCSGVRVSYLAGAAALIWSRPNRPGPRAGRPRVQFVVADDVGNHVIALATARTASAPAIAAATASQRSGEIRPFVPGRTPHVHNRQASERAQLTRKPAAAPPAAGCSPCPGLSGRRGGAASRR